MLVSQWASFLSQMRVWIITRVKLKKGEGKLKSFDPEIGNATQRRNMENDNVRTENFHKAFYRVPNMLDKLVANYEKRVAKKEKKKKDKA